MKYLAIFLILVGIYAANSSFALPHSSLDLAEFVELKDTYMLGEKFTIKFEQLTQQPCPSYQISLIKNDSNESKTSHNVEPSCTLSEPVEPYLFSDEYFNPEFFDTAGTYTIELKIGETTVFKKIEIFENTLSVTQKQVRYEVPYEITNGIVDDIQLNCDPASLVLSVSSDDSGTLRLHIPDGMFGGIFMVLVDDKEWDDVSIHRNVLTVNFLKDTKTIEFLGSHNITTGANDGVCDVVHNPPYSYILSPLKQSKAGISFDSLICPDDLTMIQKQNGIPACVTLSTKEKLIQRNWAVGFFMTHIIDRDYWSKTYSIHHMCANVGVREITDDEANRRSFWKMDDGDLNKIPIIQSMLEYNSLGLYTDKEHKITSTVVTDDIQNQYRQTFDNMANDKTGSYGRVFMYNERYYVADFSIC